MKSKTVKYLKCPKCGEDRMSRGGTNGSGHLRWQCLTGCGYKTTDPSAPYRGVGVKDKKLKFKAPIGKSETVVITWAQNATPIHGGFFNALNKYCSTMGATLVVIPGRYRNPTSRWPKSQRNEQYWAAELSPFLMNQRKSLNRNLVLLSDVPIQPTAVTPLRGFESFTDGESGIIGHPKFQMNVIPTPHQKLPKILTTTGAVTIPNYTDTRVGKHGARHHVQGAVVVELEAEGFFHLRHINARSDGAFCDLDKAYYPDGRVEPCGPYKALMFGDSHVRFNDPTLDAATFGKNGLVELLNPETLLYHDLLDGYAVNPHHKDRPFIAIAKHNAGYSELEDEVIEACNWIRTRSKGRQARIIASNHNEFFARWMDRHEWRNDPENAEFYLETALYMVRSAKITAHGASVIDPFQYWAGRLLKDSPNIRCVGRNESLMIGGVECSLHGDQGPNGARGSRANLSKIGVKSIIGHGHAPGITDGCYQGGTSTELSLEYTGAVGSWLQSHVALDPMGKRHIFTLIGGRFWKR